MKNPFIDHSFSKIVEISHEPQLAKVFIESKLKQLEEVAKVIRSSQGQHAVENVLNYKLVEHALKQCLEYTKNPGSNFSDTDYYIYFSFLSSALKEAEQIIDNELSELGL